MTLNIFYQVETLKCCDTIRWVSNYTHISNGFAQFLHVSPSGRLLGIGPKMGVVRPPGGRV